MLHQVGRIDLLIASLKYSHVSWYDTLLWPAYAAGISVFVLLCHLIYSSFTSRKDPYLTVDVTLDHHDCSGFSVYVRHLGGPVIFAFKTLRLLSCVILVFLTAAPLLPNIVQYGERDERVHFIYANLVQILLCATYVRNQVLVHFKTR